MGRAREGAEVADEKLSSPARAIGSVARSVVYGAHGRTALAVLGQYRREVRVMVLHAYEVHVVALERVRRGEVVRVQIVRDDARGHREQVFEMGDPLAEGAQRLPVAQVPDVVRHPRSLATRQAERALQLGAAGQHL